ncbi:hypothetical protein AHiyo1_14510 [Arthrobacter sp. Hiyo1]|nr:hypothetical protein AHiyo1_14510 [Arthrobacter sp. Hiyo1]
MRGPNFPEPGNISVVGQTHKIQQLRFGFLREPVPEVPRFADQGEVVTLCVGRVEVARRTMGSPYMVPLLKLLKENHRSPLECELPGRS